MSVNYQENNHSESKQRDSTSAVCLFQTTGVKPYVKFKHKNYGFLFSLVRSILLDYSG